LHVVDFDFMGRSLPSGGDQGPDPKEEVEEEDECHEYCNSEGSFGHLAVMYIVGWFGEVAALADVPWCA